MNTLVKKFATGTAALALMTTVFASTTMAAEDTSTTNIDGADNVTIGEVTADDFGIVTLTGETQTATAALNIGNIVDARGTGAGWTVAVSATPLSHEKNGKSLSANSLDVGAPVVEQADSGSSAIEPMTKTAGALDSVNGVNLLAAGSDEGMGSFSIAPIPMTLTLLPKEVYEGTYSTTVTVELTAGPNAQ